MSIQRLSWVRATPCSRTPTSVNHTWSNTAGANANLRQDNYDYQWYNGLYDLTVSATNTQFIGPNSNLPKDEWTYNWTNDGYTLDIVAINTQFNGYQFTFHSYHNLPLAFIQIFGGSPTVDIEATATSIVGNQRQTPALLTLSTGMCASKLTGAAQLTVLGDVYTNGQACLDSNLHEAGNCYAASGNCNAATYFCYNSTPGFIPYAPDPTCGSDTIGGPIVPAPTLPDPGYLATAATTDCGGASCYPGAGSYSRWNRGTYTEMPPGQYGTFHLTGGSASCAFLDAGVYTWNGGYTSDATGSLLSNELKAPDEALFSDQNSVASPQFWNQNGTSCAGHFSVANGVAQTVLVLPPCTKINPPTPAGCHTGANDTLGRNNRWGVELTSVRFDPFPDPQTNPNPCFAGCRRESAPSECQLTPNNVVGTPGSPSNVGISIVIYQNAPGAQYYNVYLNPNGCNYNQSQFGWVGRFDAPGFSGGVPTGLYPTNASPWVLGATAPLTPPATGASLYDVIDTEIANPPTECFSALRNFNCVPPDQEVSPQCFSSCPPPANLLSQENAPMRLEFNPYTGGDIANENYCQPPPGPPGDTSAPCQGAQVTPGAVQFYFPPGSCMTQNAQGATYVFAGLQFNWIVIYSPPANTCNNNMNGGASTQYIGTIYTPGANLSINGGDRSPLAGQVICYTAVVSGGGEVGIDFNPNYAPAPPAARLIN